MFAHCIDVGQADCTLLEFPCGAVLIDAGADTDSRVEDLRAYLRAFFERRSDLKGADDRGVLSAVFVTHAHIDHTRALRELGTDFAITNYIDNGFRAGMGGGDQRWLVDQIAQGLPTVHREVREAGDVAAGEAITDASIDPVHCAACDPGISVLSGGYDLNPGWPSGEFDNQNNHSLVVRVDFGQAAFLFSGDLEEFAIDTLLSRYEGTDLLDVDIYHVGHHGSHNATTTDLLDVVSPQAAVISMGRWNEGRRSDGTAKPFTTFAYGHPRKVVLDELTQAIGGYRSTPKTVMAAEGAREFESYRVKKRIYATGWDKTVKVRATLDRKFTITVNN